MKARKVADIGGYDYAAPGGVELMSLGSKYDIHIEFFGVGGRLAGTPKLGQKVRCSAHGVRGDRYVFRHVAD